MISSSDRESPLLVLAPTQHPFASMSQDRPSFTSPFDNGGTFFPSAPSSLTPSSNAPPSTAGRKRSRDEAADNLEDYFAVQAPPKEPENEDEWIYGEGMTLIKPNKGYIMDAGSQTGTWAEQKEEEEKALAALAAQQSADRPILRAAKSLRLDMTATPPIMEEVLNNGALSAPSPERTSGIEPTVDEFTRHLGIGWSSISTDPDIQAAARGWTKFIENHFAIHNAKIRLQSRGLASYLVEADEGFFLFAEDLKRGQLVSTSLEKTWMNLSRPIPVFDGELVMDAVETPRVVADPIPDGLSTIINGANGFANGTSVIHSAPLPARTTEVEMDMS